MSVDVVSAFAGDREMTPAERTQVSMQKRTRGASFYSDLLYAISHHHFAPAIAEAMLKGVLAHNRHMSRQLGRDVGITVATLDYLSSIAPELRAFTLIPEASFVELANLAMRDGMTGLFNHSSCYELLELELRSHRRYGVGVAVLLLDIDDFKLANDSNGHQEGDRVLAALATALRETARDSDICCRLGGDEFVVILRLTTDPVEACDIAERIRAKAAVIQCGGHQVSISVGVALCGHAACSPHMLMEMADRALYQAKLGGKNQVVLCAADWVRRAAAPIARAAEKNAVSLGQPGRQRR